MMLGVRAARVGDWVVLRVAGEIDLATAPHLRQTLVAEIRDDQPRVVVDLSGVDFVDSTGLGVLLGGLVRARRLGGDLRVTGLSRRLAEVFDLVDLRLVLAEPDAGIVAPTDAGFDGETR